MPPKQRPTTTKGRMVCSVDERKQSKGNVRRRGAISGEARTPIGKKFVHKSSEKSTKTLSKGSEVEQKKTPYEIWADQAVDMGVRNIRREFVSIIRTYTPAGTISAWEADKNYDKNRFEDVKLLDKTRVVLKNTPSGDDYYHASYVQISEGVHFICAQGPLTNTIEDFWCMVIQESTKVIIQLCQWVEEGKTQCSEYFPKNDSEWKDYGAIQVKVIENTTPMPQLRKVYRTKIRAVYKDKKHEVLHFLYGGWPDHFVADSTPICREVRTLALKFADKKPVIVHCSAGIGRTGTFAAISMAIDRLKRTETLSIPDIVKELRDQRMHSVQNDQQYLFIYRMVIEVLLAEDLLIKSPDIISLIKDYDEVVARKRQERARKSKK